MFDALTNAFSKAYTAIVGKKTLTEENVDEGIRAVRQALLEADVNFKVAKDFIKDVKERAVGQDVIKAVDPGQQFVKIFHDALTDLLGGTNPGLPVADRGPLVLMMAGLQGSGKTTTCAKLALHLRSKRKKNPLLVAADLQRPAAVEQLKALGKQLGIAVYAEGTGVKPTDVCKRGLEHARKHMHDVVILDTAGRLHIDEPLMAELQQIHTTCQPHGVLLVCYAMLGQDAVNSAKEFHARLPLHGVVLTKVDGDARGGAALSIKAVTGRPILYAGVGEKPDDLEEFDPARMAGRILGMGDVVGLVEKAQEVIDEAEAAKIAAKLEKGNFDFEDLLGQLRQMKKMGGLSSLMGMLPGVGKLKAQMADAKIDDKVIGRQEAIILSMTPRERRYPELIKASRKQRIAAGSGTSVQEINKLLKQHQEMARVMKQMKKLGKKGLMRHGMQGLFSRH